MTDYQLAKHYARRATTCRDMGAHTTAVDYWRHLAYTALCRALRGAR